MTNPYDVIPYPSGAFRETHPDRLGALAGLFGLPFAPVETCRVLEIGGGDGSNLIPIALSYPGVRCVGFDLAAEPVRRGQDVIEALGLTNIALFQADIRDVDLGAEPFDYIVAQGVYSWVPDGARAALMTLISRCLAPHGVAYVSYSALPGCRIRQALRDLLFFAVRDVTGPRDRLDGAIQRLKVLAEADPGKDPFQIHLIDEAKKMLARSPAGYAHDELSDDYHPVHLHAFAAHCAQNGLAVVTEAEARETGDWLAPSGLVEYPNFDPVTSAQERDFVETRYFRRSLLARADAPIDRRPQPARLLPLHMSSNARRNEVGAFVFEGVPFPIADPSLAQVVESLAAIWPATAPVASAGLAGGALGELYRLQQLGIVEMHSAASSFTITAGERPTASPLARLQARAGETRLTTLRHTMVDVDDEFSRAFIAGLDGSRTRAEIAEDVAPRFGHSPASAQAPVDVLLGVLAHAPLLVA